MKGTIHLTNPILVNGVQRDSFEYNANEITAQMFAEADAKKFTASKSRQGNLAGAAELDYGLHMYLGFMAIVAVNSDVDISDLERMKGRDIMEVMNVGRVFMRPELEALYSQNDSEEQSEITVEPFTPPDEI